MTISYVNLTNQPDPNYDVFHDNTRQRSPRVYYKATASNGRVALRGSWQDRYSHAVIKVDEGEFPNQLIGWATYSRSEQLAKRNLTRYTNLYSEKYGEKNYRFELVQLEQITAREFRKYKSLQKKSVKDYRRNLEIKELQQEGETNADTE